MRTLNKDRGMTGKGRRHDGFAGVLPASSCRVGPADDGNCRLLPVHDVKTVGYAVSVAKNCAF